MIALNGERVCGEPGHPPDELVVVQLRTTTGTVLDEICLGHALLQSCHCCTVIAFCLVTGCGDWKPIRPKAQDLLERLYQDLVEI
jgi:hypothetical protein